jgi:hypothetical protein
MYFRPGAEVRVVAEADDQGELGERGRVEQAGGVEELDAEGVRHGSLELQQVRGVGAADGVVQEQRAGVPVLVAAPVVAAQGRHRAVQRDRGGEQLAAGEHVAHLSDGYALGAQYGVGLEDLDGDALGLEGRADSPEQQGHSVAAHVGVLLDGRAGRLVDDLAEPLGERGLVGLLEADAQELLPGPLAESLGQPGQPLGRPQRGERGLHEPAQPVDDRVPVPLQLLQLVGQDPESGREGVRPLLCVLGQRGRGQLADLLAGGRTHLLVARGVGMPYEYVARLAHGVSAADRSAAQPRRERRASAADCRASSRVPG